MTETKPPQIRLNESYRGHVLCQLGNLGVDITLSELDRGIVNLIEQFGSRLYYGYPHKDVFLNYFYLHKRYTLVQELKNFDPDNSNISQSNLNNLALYLYMARLSQTQKWKYPALLNREPSGSISQETGGTRAFAVGLTKPEPWKHFPVLMLEDIDKDPGTILENPVHVANDKQLVEILGGDYDSTSWDPEIRLSVVIQKVNSGHSYCALKYVDDYNFFDISVNRGQDCLKNFIDWKRKNPGRPKIKIYTNYPNNVKDINGIWDYEIVGGTGNFEQEMGSRVGWVENMTRNYHSHDRPHGNDYVLWLVKNRIIDLGDLLPWMDNQHTTYLSTNWDFVLYRPDEIFKTTFIEASYQE